MDLQYGRTMNEPQRPLLSIDVPDLACAEFEKWIARNEESAEDVTGHGATRFRVIPFTPALFTSPLFVEVEFPERAGALLGFMNAISWITSVCYFNYAYTGERVGRALIGLDFENDEELSIHRDKIFGQAGKTVRAVKEVLAGELF